VTISQSRFVGRNLTFDGALETGHQSKSDAQREVLGKCKSCNLNNTDVFVNCANDLCHTLFLQCSDCSGRMQHTCRFAARFLSMLPLIDVCESAPFVKRLYACLRSCFQSLEIGTLNPVIYIPLSTENATINFRVHSSPSWRKWMSEKHADRSAPEGEAVSTISEVRAELFKKELDSMFRDYPNLESTE
jgi:hypothetical protein